MMKKTLYSTLLLFILFTFHISAAVTITDVLPELSEHDIEKLHSGEVLEGNTIDGTMRRLAPFGSLSFLHTVRMERLVSAEEDTGFGINTIAFLPYPEYFEDLSMEERQLTLFNTMRSISTQEGIPYISSRRGNEPQPLIRDSWYLETPRSRTRKPDPVVDELPNQAENYVHQRIYPFSSNVYRHKYTITSREILLDIDNLEPMRILSLIRVIDPEELNIVMSTYQLDEGLLLYGLASIADQEPEVSFLGIRVNLPGSFNKRILVIQDWFVDQIYSN